MLKFKLPVRKSQLVRRKTNEEVVVEVAVEVAGVAEQLKPINCNGVLLYNDLELRVDEAHRDELGVA